MSEQERTMKRRLVAVALAFVFLLVPLSPTTVTAQEPGCGYYQAQYATWEQLYWAYWGMCLFMQDGYYCELADDALRQMGNAGNMLDVLNCE